MLNPTAAQSLLSFPQFTTRKLRSDPRVRTWYDLLQQKDQATPLGLDFTIVFTWHKELPVGSKGETVGPAAR